MRRAFAARRRRLVKRVKQQQWTQHQSPPTTLARSVRLSLRSLHSLSGWKKLNEDCFHYNNSSRARSLALVLARSSSLSFVSVFASIQNNFVRARQFENVARWIHFASKPTRTQRGRRATNNQRPSNSSSNATFKLKLKQNANKKLHTKIKGEFTACLASHLCMFLCPVIFVLSRPSRVSLNWNRAARNLANRIQFEILWNCCCIVYPEEGRRSRHKTNAESVSDIENVLTNSKSITKKSKIFKSKK